MKNIINATGQLELGFSGSRARSIKPSRQTRIERAAWWFGKMRAAVDSAIAWTSRTPPPPQQTWLAGGW